MCIEWKNDTSSEIIIDEDDYKVPTLHDGSNEEVDLVNIASRHHPCVTLTLQKRSQRLNPLQQTVIRIHNHDFAWVDQVKLALLQSRSVGSNVWLLAEDVGTSGVIGMLNCLRHDTGGSFVRLARCNKNSG